MAIAPGTIVAAIIALAGLGFVVLAFLGAGFDLGRLVVGCAVIAVALLVAGAQSLLSHGGSSTEES